MSYTPTSHINTQAIEANAHKMRAEFVRDMVRAGGQWMRARVFGSRRAKLA
ncbi:RSP_7527 family protein [Celeribacter neptunius]|uniref:Uncharacterized protein n=1 Tax=Celeribacter neptunius TaxID=588602 RepID=A0A1I3LXH1_9RHOB|nr:hypothetical protein [Celeribacter neptunius]SFI89439.1 hypothetical protein SAMN04487991_1175 [Celeribacter neptunius]